MARIKTGNGEARARSGKGVEPVFSEEGEGRDSGVTAGLYQLVVLNLTVVIKVTM